MRIKKGTCRLPLYITMVTVVGIITCLYLLRCIESISAQEGEIVPGKYLEVMGVPKIPRSLADQVSGYMGAYGLRLAGWHPEKSELWLKGTSSAVWINRIESPASDPKLWLYAYENNVYDIYFQPQAKYFLFNKETNGDEVYQMYLYDIEKRKSTRLTNGRSRSTEFVWSNSGEQVIYGYYPQDGVGVSLYLMNPFEPKSNRLLVQSTGSYLKAYDWSPDDRYAVFCDFYSNVSCRLWLIDVATFENQPLSSPKVEGEYYGSPKFSKDGKGIYVITNRASEFKQLAYLDLRSKKFNYLTAGIKWDVDGFQISPDGKTVAFTINEDGISRLHLLDTVSRQQKIISSLPVGVISGLKWHSNSNELAFNFTSARIPNDVYVLNAASGQVQRWAKSISGGVELEKLAIPELIRWKSFDGRTISGFMYRPPAIFTGKRPVIIDIHGGPEDQHRPGYGYYDNFFINELGIVKISPNVRGSSGYGKTFLSLDNGIKREDAVKDIGALLDWIRTQPDLDSDRILVQGASYGGYLALSAAVKYNDGIRAAISDVGPSNLATLMEATTGWRRALRLGEYGDERDPKIRAFMERTAPVNNIRKTQHPLLIVHGKNDPRVPVGESQAIVEAAKEAGIPVWYLLATDEGHGFTQHDNRNFQLYSTILFVKEYLLR